MFFKLKLFNFSISSKFCQLIPNQTFNERKKYKNKDILRYFISMSFDKPILTRKQNDEGISTVAAQVIGVSTDL